MSQEGNAADFSIYDIPGTTGWPWYNQTQTITVTSSTLPTWCTGNVHVWGCDHAEACKCGQVFRKAPGSPKCPHCGKEHR